MTSILCRGAVVWNGHLACHNMAIRLEACLPSQPGRLSSGTAAKVRELSPFPAAQSLDADQHDRAHGHHCPGWWFRRQRHSGSNVASGGCGTLIAGFNFSPIQSKLELSRVRHSQRRIADRIIRALSHSLAEKVRRIGLKCIVPTGKRTSVGTIQRRCPNQGDQGN